MILTVLLVVALGSIHDVYADEYWGGCSTDTFPCAGTSCLPCETRCNGVNECADGSDEYQCAPPIACAAGHQVYGLEDGSSILVRKEQVVSVIDGILTLNINGEIVNKTLGCGTKPAIKNGKVYLISSDSSIGTTALVKCDDGFQTCDAEIKCHCSGRWSAPVCKPIPVPEEEPLRCFRCVNEETNANCNQRTEVCNHNKMTCETTIEYLHHKIKIKKGCKNPTAASQNRDCYSRAQKTTCRYECQGDLCNELIPPACAECGTDEIGNGRCKQEHGECTNQNVEKYYPLRISDCQKYCMCTNDAEANGPAWKVKMCQLGEEFDGTNCVDAFKFECHGPTEDVCANEHGIPNETMMVNSPRQMRSGTKCKEFCEVIISDTMEDGTPIYRWRIITCHSNQVYDPVSNLCKMSSETTCPE